MLCEFAITCITPPLENKPLKIARLKVIDTRKCVVLGTDTITQCAISDRTISPPEIVFLRVKQHDAARCPDDVAGGENWL
jgi:hypothetical protein